MATPSPVSATRLSRTVIALGFVSLFTDISSEMVYTQIPIYLTTVLLAPVWAVGLIEGIAESTASLLKLVSGYLSDMSGKRKPLTAAGYFLGAISKPLLVLAVVWPLVLLLRFVDRLGKGLRTAPRDALIAETTPQPLRGRAFGLHRTMDTTGAVLGPLIGVFFLRHTSGDPTHKFRMLFLCAGIFGAIAVLLVLFAVREPAPEKPTSSATLPEKRAHPLPRWSALHPTYRRFLLIALLFNLGNSSDAFLILRAKSVGFSPEDLLWLYAAFNLVEAAFGYAAGRLSDQVGRRPLIIAGFGVFAFVYFGFALASSRTAIWFLFLLYGGYYTLTQGVQRAFAADLADAQQRAGQIGAYHAVVGFALLPASLIAGFLYSRHAALPFFVGASTATLSALLLLTLREKR